MKTTYYGYFKPSQEGYRYNIPGLTLFDKIDTNKAKLAKHLLAYADGYAFESYPVTLVILNDSTEEVVERWVQEEEGGRWIKRKGEGA